jgi:peptide chain release factor 2
VEELEAEMAKPEFWNDQETAQPLIVEMKQCKAEITRVEAIADLLEEFEMMLELADLENPDTDAQRELIQIAKAVETDLEKLSLDTLLHGEYDHHSAIISIHAGSGGTDAQDWAQMLLRMELRWCEKKGYSITELDLQRDTEAGVKSATYRIGGKNAYGYLKTEKGVHRLVRISPFDSSGKRHTSFSSVDVMPELADDEELEIDQKDLRVDTYRSSGAGGQHVNKTDSAIRITHVPTGIVVQCQNERSQIKNRATAMKMLMAKLIEIQEQEKKEKIEDIQGNYREIAWGNQIRSYVFHPYSMVKDHRTQTETGNVQAVMDGDLDRFMESYLKLHAKGK